MNDAIRDSMHLEREMLVEWLDKPELDMQKTMYKTGYYNEFLIFKMAMALDCDAAKAEEVFQKISETLETLCYLKDEFYEIMDVEEE